MHGTRTGFRLKKKKKTKLGPTEKKKSRLMDHNWHKTGPELDPKKKKKKKSIKQQIQRGKKWTVSGLNFG